MSARSARTLPGSRFFLGLVAAAILGCGAGDGEEQAPSGGLAGSTATDEEPTAHLPEYTTGEVPRYSVAERVGVHGFQIAALYDGLLLAGDRAVLDNHGVGQIIVLDSLGEVVALAGGIGEGPGELSAHTQVLPAGDARILVRDRRQGRLAIFGLDGTHLGDEPLPRSRGVRSEHPDEPIGWLEGRGPVTCRTMVVRRGQPPPDRHLCRIWSAGERADSIVVEGPPPYPRPLLEIATDGGSVFWSIPPGLRPKVSHSVLGPYLIRLDSGRGTITLLDGSGGVVREFAGPVSRRPIDPPYLERFTEQHRTFLELLVESGELEGELVEAAAQALAPVGDSVPMWFGLRPDPTGRIWAALDPPGGPQGRWMVFDVRGEALGTVTIPEDRDLLAVRGDRILVRRLGEFDEAYAELFDLVPVGDAPPLGDGAWRQAAGALSGELRRD